jgi:hypothetical protein
MKQGSGLLLEGILYPDPEARLTRQVHSHNKRISFLGNQREHLSIQGSHMHNITCSRSHALRMPRFLAGDSIPFLRRNFCVHLSKRVPETVIARWSASQCRYFANSQDSISRVLLASEGGGRRVDPSGGMSNRRRRIIPFLFCGSNSGGKYDTVLPESLWHATVCRRSGSCLDAFP